MSLDVGSFHDELTAPEVGDAVNGTTVGYVTVECTSVVWSGYGGIEPDGVRRVNDPVVPGATCGSVDCGSCAL